MEEFYKKIGKIYCPYFKEDIHFTHEGLFHLKFKKKFKARVAKDSQVRFRLLPIAIKILGASHTLQGKVSRQSLEFRFVNARKEIAFRRVTYYEFIAILDQTKAKVILKQIEDEHKTFLSVIPLYKQKTPPVGDDSL